ncbi:MAG: tRNA (adenosine(37)-N6)-threonylcarbamoyltransferase complex dimerization subunit type 1 TsaB [Candidatus Binatia bacterium]
MDSETGSKYTLAIESAVGGGSISLQIGGSEIADWSGSDNVSRAEDLLPNMIDMLARSSVDRRSIGRIAVSVGPGSYTGIRIGIATALGLKAALGVPCVGVPVLKAMAMSSAGVGSLLAAVPMGRRSICFQTFNVSGDRQVKPASDPVVCNLISDHLATIENVNEIVVYDSILAGVREAMPGRNIRSTGFNLARLIGTAVDGIEETGTIEPIFLTPAVQVVPQ